MIQVALRICFRNEKQYRAAAVNGPLSALCVEQDTPTAAELDIQERRLDKSSRIETRLSRMERSDGEDRYRSEAALRAREVFRAFELTGETLRLRGLVSRTGLNKSTVFRLLHQSKAG